jgi:hypothetical protein
MMPAVLTADAKVLCTFGGTVMPAGSAKLVVANNPVVTQSGLENQPVTACGAGASQQPICATVGTVTAGLAAKLVVAGAPVLLDQTLATTNLQTPSHVVGPVAATQTKLVAT